MHHVVDPALLELGTASWLFLLVVGGILPALALRQHRQLGSARLTVSRVAIYVSVAGTHLVLLVLAALVLREQQTDFFPPYARRTFDVIVGLMALALGMLPLIRRLFPMDPLASARTRMIAPRTFREHASFYFLCVGAGIAEEVSFRGVLFALLAAVAGGWWVPAIIASALFGAAHLFQGPRSAVIAGFMGLREQIVVGLTGTLFVAIVVHILHNVIAATVISLRARHEDDE